MTERKIDDSNVAEYQQTKEDLKPFLLIWQRNFAPRHKVGCCSELYKRFHPNSYQEFLEAYNRDGEINQNLDKVHRGRTEFEIIELAKEYKVKCEAQKNVDYPLETYIKNIYCHVIVETFDGQERERTLAKMLESSGYTVTEVYGDDDAELGADLWCEKDDEIFAVQVKPLTFFLGNSNQSLINDRIGAHKKVEKCLKKYGKKTFYVVYSQQTNTFLKKKNGKFAFRLEEFCDKQGHTNNFTVQDKFLIFKNFKE